VIRVLVVDDHPVLRAGLEAVLRAEPGFACVGTAGDGNDLQQIVRRTRPDVVVLDRRLGAQDGLDLCRVLRAEVSPPEIVLYTATADAALARAGAEAGAHSVIEKGANVAELFDALRLASRGRAPLT
jgi:DNA-binding NarL/FixJ family response regulator